MELSGDQSQEFGKKVASFITDMRARSTEPHQKISTEPHQKMMLEVRRRDSGCGFVDGGCGLGRGKGSGDCSVSYVVCDVK